MRKRTWPTIQPFKDMITSFPPGAEIVFSLAQSFVIFADNADSNVTPSCFTITAEYSFGDKRVKETNIIDLRPYLGASIPQDAYIRKLKAIKRINTRGSQSDRKGVLTIDCTGSWQKAATPAGEPYVMH